MSPRTSPSASANNLHLIFRAFVGVNFRNCPLLHVYVLSVRPVDHLWRQLAHESLPLVVLFQARSGRFWIDAETLDESFDFPDVKNLSITSLTGLKLIKVIKVPPHFHSVINWSEGIKSLPPFTEFFKVL